MILLEPTSSEAGAFEEVRSKRKRKKTEMELEGGGSETKRPSFPPIDASAILVRHKLYYC